MTSTVWNSGRTREWDGAGSSAISAADTSSSSCSGTTAERFSAAAGSSVWWTADKSCAGAAHAREQHRQLERSAHAHRDGAGLPERHVPARNRLSFGTPIGACG